MSDFFEEIGELRQALAALDVQEALIFIEDQPPTALSSYRGYYRDLAIECDVWGIKTPTPGHDETKLDERGDPFHLGMAGYDEYSPGHQRVYIKRDPTVAELIKALDLAVGESFEGYKGGQFRMEPSSDIWVAEYGMASSRRIFKQIDVSVDRVDLKTYVVP